MIIYEAWTAKSCDSKYFLSIEKAVNYLVKEYIKHDFCWETAEEDIDNIMVNHHLEGICAIFETEVIE